MGLLADIAASYRRPRGVLRRLAAGPEREDRALALLMAAAALIFLSQWPRAARAAHLDPSAPLDARLVGALLASVFLLPLLAYGVAAVSHVAARMLGGRGSGFGARLALFWALLATAPLMLLHGLLAGFAGPGPVAWLFGLLVFGAFLWIWLSGLWEMESES
jgi:hypothetical protein